MNSLERALSTIRLSIPDRVPVDLHNFAMAAAWTGRPFGEVFHSGALMAEGQLALWRRFGHDILLLENGTTALAEALGCKVIYPDDGPPKLVEPVLKRLGDVDDLPPIDPARDGTLPELLDATRRVAEAVGNSAFVMGRADQGPFSLAAMLRGMDQFLLDLALGSQPEKIHRLLEFTTGVCTSFALAQLAAGAHGTSIGESLAGPSVVSPRMYEEYALPYEQKVVRAVKQAGGIFALHICGNTTRIVDKMVQSGADILEIDEETDLRVAKRAAAGKCALLGPVSPGALRNETSETVAQLAREALEVAAPGGGFILGPGCALAADTPAANIEALMRAAELHGKYTA